MFYLVISPQSTKRASDFNIYKRHVEACDIKKLCKFNSIFSA